MIKYDYDVYDGKISKKDITNFVHCGELRIRKDNLDIITEHYVNGGAYDVSLVYLDFHYTLDELKYGGLDFIKAKRCEHFIQNNYSPSMYFDLDYVIVPKKFYGELLNEKSK